MRRGIGFLILFSIAIFVLPLGSAQDMSCSGDTLFIMSAESNAHAQIDATPIFPNPEYVCFNGYFKDDSNSGSTLSTVIRLSGLGFNAHAEDPSYSTSGYIDVDYPGMFCEIVDYDTSCENTEHGGNIGSVIVYLSKDTNAHLGFGGDVNSAEYPHKLCCASEDSLPICNYDNDIDSEETEWNCPEDFLAGSCNNDGTKDPEEECDGGELGGETCESQGYASGTLSCDNNCNFDYSLCENGGVGNICEDLDQDGDTTDNAWEYSGGDCPQGTTCSVEKCSDVSKMDSTYDLQGICESCYPAEGFADPGKNGFSDMSMSEWGCAWNVNATTGNECSFFYTDISGETCYATYEDITDCANADSLTKQVSVTYSGEGCTKLPEEVTITCPRVLQLPFFSWMSFVITAFVVVFIYCLFGLTKKK